MPAAGRRPRLLVFGINYEPEPTGQALNTTWAAETLAERGWGVSVVTGIPHYPSWRPEPIPVHSPDEPVQVVHRRHYVPRRQSAVRRGMYELTWFLAALRDALRPRQVDLVVGVVPSLGGAALATVAAARHRIPYALIFYDLVGRAADQSGVPGAARVAGAVQRFELALARRAAGVAFIAEGFRQYFLDAGVDLPRLVRVRNPARLTPSRVTPRFEDRGATRARLGWAENEFVVLHTGSMGYKQGLENVIGAAREARKIGVPVRFVLQGDGNQRSELEERARRLGLSNLTFQDLAPVEEFPAVLAAADALLLNQRGSVRNMSLPSKLGSYFAAGVPVIAAVAAGDEAVTEITGAGAGVVVEPDSPEALLGAVRQLRSDPEGASRMGAAGKAYAGRTLTFDGAISGIEAFLAACLEDSGRREHE